MEHQISPEPASPAFSQSETYMPNRRSHPRYPCEGRAEVYLPHGGMMLRGKIRNLSISGCFIEAPAITLERGTRVEVYFSTRQLQIRVAGHIAVLHRKRGAGIAFQEMIPHRARQIADLVSELKHLAEARNAIRAETGG